MSLSTSPGNNGDSKLAKAIRIGLSFVNYSKPFNEITTSNDDFISSSSSTTKTAPTFSSKSNNNINFHKHINNNDDSKCPGDFCSRTSSVLPSSSSSSSLSTSSSSSVSTGRTASGNRITNSISASGSVERIGPGNEFPSQLTSTSKPTVTESSKVNLVDSRITDYYSDYDPMMGIRIAISLLGIIVLFAIFVVYKSHCNAKKAKRLLPYRGSTRSVSGYRTP